jgi:hypothetical protein
MISHGETIRTSPAGLNITMTKTRSYEGQERSLRKSAGAAGAAIVVFLGWILHHGLLVLLWPERSSHGLLTAVPEGSLSLANPVSNLTGIVLFPWIVLFLAAVMLRLAETHPRFFVGLTWTSGSPIRSASRILAFYVVVALIGLSLEHTLDFHFVTSIALYVITATLLAGCIFAGQRRPFLDVSLSRPAPATRRRTADVVSVVLLVALYVELIFDRPLWHLQDDILPWAWALMLLAFAVLGAVLGWALLHGSLAGIPRRFVHWIEARPDSPAGKTSPRAFDGIAHIGAVAVVLLALRGLFTLWTSDFWWLPRDNGSTVFLGVDWYFIHALKSAVAGEVMVLLVFAWTGWIVLKART